MKSENNIQLVKVGDTYIMKIWDEGGIKHWINLSLEEIKYIKELLKQL